MNLFIIVMKSFYLQRLLLIVKYSLLRGFNILILLDHKQNHSQILQKYQRLMSFEKRCFKKVYSCVALQETHEKEGTKVSER